MSSTMQNRFLVCCQYIIITLLKLHTSELCCNCFAQTSYIIIIIIIQLHFRPQPIDKHIQIQHGRILYTVEYVHILVIDTVYSAQLYNQ